MEAKKLLEITERHCKKQINELKEKGYLVDPAEEEKLFRKEYLNFIDERDSDEVQLFFTPWYSCNFACSYCFQDEYAHAKDQLSDQVIDAFYAYVDEHFAHRRKYITLFGGEPLLNSCQQFAATGATVTDK